MDIQSQIDYWLSSSKEDMEVAKELLEKQRFRHALFFAHLSLEKAIKAHVTKATSDVPPRIHNLIRLGELAGLSLPSDWREFLGRFDVYQLEGRYPEEFNNVQLTVEGVLKLLSTAKEIREWLMTQLS